MANLQLKNNAYSALAAGIGTGDTSITVTTGQGDRFPEVGSGTYFKLTLQDASNNIEIIKVTTRTSGSDSMTVTRAQEGTTARSWSLGDAVELRVTSGILAPLALLDEAATIADFRTAINVPARTESTLIGDSDSDTMTVESTSTFNGPTTISAALTATTAGNKITVSGTGSTFTVAPATAGTLNNVAIGGTTAAAGAFTTLAASSTVTLSGALTFNGNGVITVQNSANSLFIGGSATNPSEVNLQAVALIRSFIGATERCRVASGGYLKASNTGTYGNVAGLGSLSASNGHVFQSDANTSTFSVVNGGTDANITGVTTYLATGAAGLHFQGRTNNVAVYRVLANGDVQNTNNVYGAISDPKVKNIIGSKGSTWNETKAFNWIEYYLKTDSEQTKKLLGLNAAEAKQVASGVVAYTDDSEPVTKTRTVTKNVPVTVTEQQEQTKTETQFIDGAWREITTTQTVDVQVPVYDEFPLVDANGDPVIELVSPAVDAVLDEDGNEIEPAVDAVYAQKVHKVARTEEVTETEEYTENEPTGEQTMAVKYSVVSMQYHRTVQEAQHRIEALEVANADLLGRVLALESA